MSWMEILCPGCKQKRSVPPGNKYKACDKCGTPHCGSETGTCKLSWCNGWLKDRENPR